MTPAGRVQHVNEAENPESPKDAVTVSGIKSAVQFWVPLILIVVSLVVGWVTMGNQIQTVKADQARLETSFSDHLQDVDIIRAERDQQYLEMQITLAQIQKDIAYIRIQVDAQKP
jgi:hypothetical protein